MKTIWIVLACVGVFLLLLFYLAVRWIKLAIYRALTGTPPLEIHLEGQEQPCWSDKTAVEKAVRALGEQGFDVAGVYRIPEMFGLQICALRHPGHEMSAVVYEHPVAGVWTDVCVDYANGDGLTVSNAPMGDEMDRMPGQIKIMDPEASVTALVDRALTERGPGPYTFPSAAGFAAYFEGQYAREMAWRLERGGVTMDEVRRVAANMDEDVSEETIQETYDHQIQEYRRMREGDEEEFNDGEGTEGEEC